jgi:ubiquinone/menaquinone biosynthesis C-methylase UbiE
MEMSHPANQFSDGAAYERLMGRWSRLVGQQFLAWIAVPKAQNWLDVGCGNGAFTAEICAKAEPKSIVGVDPSEAQLEFARSRLDIKNATFSTGDAQNLNFADQQFDASVMALVIAFVANPLNAVKELARVTKAGGVVATYMWDLPGGGLPLQPLNRALHTLGMAPAAPPQPGASTKEQLLMLWQSAGLCSVETSTLKIDVGFQNFDDFWQSCTIPVGPLGKFIESLDASTLERLKTELRQSLPLQPDGQIVYVAFANAVKGKKA